MMSVAVLFLLLILPILGDGAEQPEQWCSDKCGDVEVPFPFGMKEGCYLNKDFFMNCDSTSQPRHPPKLFLGNSPINVTRISLEGRLHILALIGRKCYNRSGVLDRNLGLEPWFWLSKFYVNNTGNKFVVVGCDSYGYIHGQSGDKRYTMGCMSICESVAVVNNGTCKGGGCCEASIPEDMSRFNLTVGSFQSHTSVWNFNPCSYALLVESEQFRFTLDNLTNLRNVEKLPAVLDWTIGNETCEMAKKNLSSYACQDNSDCNDVIGYSGYRCSCKNGYEGNPYLVNGCKDIDECQLNICEKQCENTPGGFNCLCPKGYHGDGKKGGQGCIRGESLVFKLVAGIALGIIVLLLTGCWLHLELKRRRLMKMREKFFLQNGGKLLEEKINRRGISSDMLKIFSEFELLKATNNFHSSMIIGQGGYGTVYKGFLPDNKIVAIKKSKEVDPTQTDEFTNEVIVLNKINHKNVVKLLGCCLDTQVPLLVYEFISNGALSEHIHNKAKARFLSWDMRLKIASETAVVLSYLHSEASPKIIHRDVKSANILLDDTFTAKVSDFGASRLVTLDQSQLSIVVRGTFGYLDPECLRTHQMTEKSDVYSFGVLLVELLTGMKAVSSEGPAEERNLAQFFISVMEQDRLFKIVQDNIVVREEDRGAIKKVAVLARSCLNMTGDDRPSMKVIAMELEGLRLGEIKHSWVQTEHNAEDMQSLLSGIGESSNSTSIGFDSLKDHIIPPLGNGR